MTPEEKLLVDQLACSLHEECAKVASALSPEARVRATQLALRAALSAMGTNLMERQGCSGRDWYESTGLDVYFEAWPDGRKRVYHGENLETRVLPPWKE